MADEKEKIVTDATGPDAGPAPAQPEAGGGAPSPKQEQPTPEAPAPDKAEAPEQAAPTQQDMAADAPKEQKAASVSVFNFSEIMAEKKAAERTAAQQEAKGPEQAAPPAPSKEAGPKQEQPEKRRGRPPKEDKAKAAAPTQKEAPTKKGKTAQKPAPAKKAEKAPKAPKPAKGAPEVKAPVQAETPAVPAGAPRPAKDEQIVYIKLSELHAFKNHPFQVRNDEEMKAMVSSVRDKGVTQPAIVRPREDGGYEIVSGHRRQKASELAGFTDMKAMTKQIPKHLSKRSPRYLPSFSGKTEQIFSRVQTREKHGKAILPSRKQTTSLMMNFPHGLKMKRKIFKSWSMLENGQKQKRQKHLSITMKSLNLF